MSEKKRPLVPRLRFLEFRDKGEWNVKQIGQISENITAGGTPSTSAKEYWGGSIRWMNSGELNYKKVHEVQGRITEEGLRNSSTKIIPKMCVLIGLAGQGKTRGTVAMNMVELCINQSIAAIFPNERSFSSDFLYYNLDNKYDELRSLSAGGEGRGGLNLQIIKSLRVTLPSLPEQQKIADCLTSLDDLISAQNQKVEALKRYKKGLMQQIFPREGETIPRLRFPEFREAGKWKAEKVESIISLVAPPKKIPTSEYLESGLFPIIDQSQKTVSGWTNDAGAVIKSKSPQIIFGDHTCVLKIYHQPFAQGADGIKVFIGKPFIHSEFLYQALQVAPVLMEEYKRHFSTLKERIVYYPGNIEQQHIADCLSSLDDLIVAQAKKIDLLKRHKKSLMQQLFPVLDESQG